MGLVSKSRRWRWGNRWPRGTAGFTAGVGSSGAFGTAAGGGKGINVYQVATAVVFDSVVWVRA
jgi:hypothetical protein